MTSSFRKYGLLIFAIILAAAVFYIFYLDFRYSDRELTFATIDVGQGDAIFIESPTGTQILIDAGPPRRILGQLARLMPPFDRSLDAIILTHPDQDHIGGFAEVLRNYKVKMVLEPGSHNASQTYANLKNLFEDKGIPVTLARRGMRLHLGGGAVLDILFPDRDVSSWVTNDASIIARLSYGESSFMLTGDATRDTEQVVLDYGTVVKSDVLKVGHHGSKTSTSSQFVQAVAPEYALISAGADNRYGHPHESVVDTLREFGADILSTYEVGTIIFKCDKMSECKTKISRD